MTWRSTYIRRIARNREAKESLKKIQAKFCQMCQKLTGRKSDEYCLKQCEWHQMFNLIMDELNGS